jgi:hypothetical protein
MGNPHEYREVMKAAFGYSDRTTDEVIAEQEARHKQPSSPKRRGKSAPAAPTPGTPRQSEMDKLAKLLAGGNPRPPQAEE